jgi:hypothetical protein
MPFGLLAFSRLFLWLIRLANGPVFRLKQPSCFMPLLLIDLGMYQAVQYYDPGNVLIGHTGPACVDKK